MAINREKSVPFSIPLHKGIEHDNVVAMHLLLLQDFIRPAARYKESILIILA